MTVYDKVDGHLGLRLHHRRRRTGESLLPGRDRRQRRRGQPFINDGGYDGTEWVGTNTINGASVKGAFDNTYGAKPQTFSPSAAIGSQGTAQPRRKSIDQEDACDRAADDRSRPCGLRRG